MSSRLATFEPAALPIARAVWPANAARTEVTSSGSDVPKPTTTAPMRAGDQRRCTANGSAPATNTSAAFTSSTSPATGATPANGSDTGGA
jgi:hypothetical protein